MALIENGLVQKVSFTIIALLMGGLLYLLKQNYEDMNSSIKALTDKVNALELRIIKHNLQHMPQYTPQQWQYQELLSFPNFNTSQTASVSQGQL